MPQCLQNVCFAVRVLNSYVVRSSFPLRSSKHSGGTIRWRIPFLVHIEQLQSLTRVRSAVTRNRTRPQWQPPSIVLSMVVTFEITLPPRSRSNRPFPRRTSRIARDRAPARQDRDGGRRATAKPDRAECAGGTRAGSGTALCFPRLRRGVPTAPPLWSRLQPDHRHSSPRS